jgi:hypothetical protein
MSFTEVQFNILIWFFENSILKQFNLAQLSLILLLYDFMDILITENKKKTSKKCTHISIYAYA